MRSPRCGLATPTPTPIHARVQVFDTGCGLSCDPKSLFKPYAQDMGGTARQTRNRFERGTGLGLAISAQLVKLMGGDIGLENRTDGVRGARFWFWVPYQAAEGLEDVSEHSDELRVSMGQSALQVDTQQSADDVGSVQVALPGTMNAADDASADATSIAGAEKPTHLQVHQQQRRSHRAAASGISAAGFALLRPTQADARRWVGGLLPKAFAEVCVVHPATPRSVT